MTHLSLAEIQFRKEQAEIRNDLFSKTSFRNRVWLRGITFIQFNCLEAAFAAERHVVCWEEQAVAAR